jgi:hypothetical protein
MENTEPFEERYQQELLLSRKILKTEMGKALAAISPTAKRALVARWKQDYGTTMFNDLMSVAKNPDARYRIANWNLSEFDKDRKKGMR